ncbi:hypothetical protein [Sorangium sp. So ce1024]|uniref:hypothetical protein n=1 Tax=Sorangium sp. So ce1024 TaxID=3133327 RepID=UPI003F0D3598
MRASPLLSDGRALLDADRLVRAGVAERRASFELSFTAAPPHTGFLVVAGVEAALDALARGGDHLEAEEVSAVGAACGLSDALVERLAGAAISVDIDAVPDGTIAFPGAPVVSVEGPFVEALLVGSLLVPALRRGTAAATRAARLHIASDGGAVVDGSSARVPFADEALALARAAHVGGAAATTSALAAAALGIPFRGEAGIDLGELAPPPSPLEGSWPWYADRMVDLGGHDEEAMLLEARRVGTTAGGWVASALAEPEGLPAARYELVALEESGAWALRQGASGRGDVIAGRKLVARYYDEAGRAVTDVIHLAHERMLTPRALGVARLAPLARAVVRGGRALEAPEPPGVGRERSVAARALLPHAVAHLRAPARYPVQLSPALIALREPEPPGSWR